MDPQARADGQDEPCRVSRHAGPIPQLGIVASVGLAVAGFAACIRYTGWITVPKELDSATRYDLWRGLLAGIVGFALAASVLFVIQLHAISHLGRGRPPTGRIVSWVVLVLLAVGGIVGMLIASSTQDEARADLSNIGATLNADIRPITAVVGLCAVPGLVTFVALAWVMSDDRHWSERGHCRVQLLLRARAEIRRSLVMLGALLTMIVVAAGLRRRALLAFDPDLDEPVEGVLMYGLVFVLLLGGFYGIAGRAIEARASSMIDQAAPLPGPEDEDVDVTVQRRQTLETLLGVSATWKSFETVVVIAAPLLTALVGVATGE